MKTRLTIAGLIGVMFVFAPSATLARGDGFTEVVKMIERFYQSGKLIVVPRHQGKRGHPVIFSRQLFGELLSAPTDQGAKAVVNAHVGETLEIDTEDVGITLDIDTPELYRQHVKGE